MSVQNLLLFVVIIVIVIFLNMLATAGLKCVSLRKTCEKKMSISP